MAGHSNLVMIKPLIKPIISTSPKNKKKIKDFATCVSQCVQGPMAKGKYGKFFTITADTDSAVSGSWDRIQKIRYEQY